MHIDPVSFMVPVSHHDGELLMSPSTYFMSLYPSWYSSNDLINITFAPVFIIEFLFEVFHSAILNPLFVVNTDVVTFWMA